VAIFGTVSAVSAQKAETVVLADTLADPMVYLAGWDGTNGTCDGTCDGSQDHFGWSEDGAGRQFQLGNQGAESCPNDGTCTMDQTQSASSCATEAAALNLAQAPGPGPVLAKATKSTA
jgi:hypothetical protein